MMVDPRPITCRELIDFIAEYVAGELDAASRRLFEQHLEGCRSCRSYLASYRTTMMLTREMVATDELVEGVPEELKAAIRSRALWRKWW